MSGGQWSDPVDVGVEGVPTTLLTAIADNLRCLHKGNGQTSIVTVAADPTQHLDINETDDVFKIEDGTNNISLILSTNRQPVNKIYLLCDVEVDFETEDTQSGNYYPLKYLSSPGTLTASAGTIVQLIFTGVDWRLGFLTQ